MADDLTHPQVLALFRDKPLDFPPGQQFRYSNSGYYLLGMIIERSSGKSYGSYIEELTKSAGLNRIAYCPNDPADGHARGFRRSPGGPMPAPRVSMTHVFYAAGALCSTAADLAMWPHVLASGQVISADSYRLMTTPTPMASGGALRYGYGTIVEQLPGMTSISHPGGQIGYSAALSYYPDHKVAVAVLANLEGVNATAIVRQVADVILRTN